MPICSDAARPVVDSAADLGSVVAPVASNVDEIAAPTGNVSTKVFKASGLKAVQSTTVDLKDD